MASSSADSEPRINFCGIAAQPFDVYVVLDFEATCVEGGCIANQEVIEFPMVLVDALTATPVAEFQRYVRPVKNPVLSSFCTNLTGITQNMVSSRDTFPVVLREALQFLTEAGLGDAAPMRSYCVVTCGDWDLKTMLPAQMRVSGREKTPLSFQRWCNIKKCMSRLGFHDSRRSHGPSGLPGMLQMLGLQLQGRHHSGIDDCRNIAAVLCALLKRGFVIDVTFSATPFLRWHASADAQLPALAQLPSTLAEQEVEPSESVSPPSLSHPRTEGIPQKIRQQQPLPNRERSGTRSTSASTLVPSPLVIDLDRDAVTEILSAENTAVAFPQAINEEKWRTVSKFLSALLRHKAVQWRVPITSNGYILLDDVLRQLQVMRKLRVSVQDIARVVRDSDKQRFRLVYGAADGRLYIAATQGHSIDGIVPQLRALTSVEEVPLAVHGTYWKAWEAILQCGYLSTMTRQHIHFSKGLVNDMQVISGMRQSVQLFVYLDVAATLSDGVKLYESANGVILTPGVGDTRQLPLKYVAKVVERSSGRIIYPV